MAFDTNCAPNPCEPDRWLDMRSHWVAKDQPSKIEYLEPRLTPENRLRQRILKSGPESLSDSELLEYLLSPVGSRQGITHLSEQLAKQLGGLAGVVDSTPAQLSRIGGLEKSMIAMIKVVPEIARRMALLEISDRPVLSSSDKVLEYCRIVLGRKRTEQFHLLFLDTKNRLIADEKQQKGTVNHTPLYPREVVKRALELDAAAVIMVHNHPSGDATPSKADITITGAVKSAVETVDIALHDHLVISRSGHNSFRTLGLL